MTLQDDRQVFFPASGTPPFDEFGRQDPSVSPGVGGEVRQRRTPKPGIPHFRIQWQNTARNVWHEDIYMPWFIPLNQEATNAMRLLLILTDRYWYFRGGITPRLKPR